jgi:hypothetical protein
LFKIQSNIIRFSAIWIEELEHALFSFPGRNFTKCSRVHIDTLVSGAKWVAPVQQFKFLYKISRTEGASATGITFTCTPEAPKNYLITMDGTTLIIAAYASRTLNRLNLLRGTCARFFMQA